MGWTPIKEVVSGDSDVGLGRSVLAAVLAMGRGANKGEEMIARVWHGVVPVEKADDYGRYLADSDRGVRDYQGTPGNRGVCLLRNEDGNRAHFLLISFWESREAIKAYAGPDIERARYFPYDRECLLEPEPKVAHYEVLVAPELGAP